MKRLSTHSMWLIVAAAFLGTLSFAVAGMGAVNGTVTVDFQDTPIQSALETLFRGTGYSYTLDPGPGRAVTVSLRDVPFLGALQSTLRAAGLTYKFEDGVYSIKPQDSSISGSPTAYTPPPSAPGMSEIELPPAEVRVEKIPLNFADAFDISEMFGSEQFTSRGNAYATSGGGGYMYGFGSSGGGGYGMPGFNTYGYGGYGGSNSSGNIRSGGYGGYGNYGGYGSNTGGYNSGAYGGAGRSF